MRPKELAAKRSSGETYAPLKVGEAACLGYPQKPSKNRPKTVQKPFPKTVWKLRAIPKNRIFQKRKNL